MGGDDDGQSFDDFYRRTVQRITHHLYAMTGSLGEAQDCVQEAYTRAWQRWGQVRAMSDPEAWVRTVARRVAVSRWRRTRTAARHLLTHSHEPTVAAPSEDHLLLVEALRAIPDAQRHAIVLHHLVGLSVDQVAAETGAPNGTVKARLRRGRAALAAVIGPLDAPVDQHPQNAKEARGGH